MRKNFVWAMFLFNFMWFCHFSYGESRDYEISSCFDSTEKELQCWQQMKNDVIPERLYDFGVHYVNGDRVSQDFIKGRFWIHRSALLGYPLAQYNIGVMFYDGIGGIQSRECALYWLNRATLVQSDIHRMALQAIDALRDDDSQYPKVIRVLTEQECEQVPDDGVWKDIGKRADEFDEVVVNQVLPSATDNMETLSSDGMIDSEVALVPSVTLDSEDTGNLVAEADTHVIIDSEAIFDHTPLGKPTLNMCLVPTETQKDDVMTESVIETHETMTERTVTKDETQILVPAQEPAVETKTEQGALLHDGLAEGTSVQESNDVDASTAQKVEGEQNTNGEIIVTQPKAVTSPCSAPYFPYQHLYSKP